MPSPTPAERIVTVLYVPPPIVTTLVLGQGPAGPPGVGGGGSGTGNSYMPAGW